MPTKRSALAAITVALLLVSVLPAGTAVASHGDGADCSFPLTATDATDANVTVSEAPDRVVVLGPSAAQTAWEVGARDAVVGVDAASAYLEGASNLTTVASYQDGIDYEAALGLDPDLVVLAGDSYQNDDVTEFRDAGVPTYKMPNAGSLDAVVEKTRTAGHLYGTCEAATETADWMAERIDVVESATADESAPSLFYDLGASEDGSARFSVGPSTFIGHLVSAAGGSNVVADANVSSPYPQISNEFIAEEDPEWLLVTYVPGVSTSEDARQAVQNSSVLSQTTAATEGNVVAVNTNNLNQPAPRVIYPLQTLAQELHPEAYAAANQTSQPTATATATETPTQTATGTDVGTVNATLTGPTETPTATDGGSSGGVPGFGAGAALVALAAAALIAGRRDQ